MLVTAAKYFKKDVLIMCEKWETTLAELPDFSVPYYNIPDEPFTPCTMCAGAGEDIYGERCVMCGGEG